MPRANRKQMEEKTPKITNDKKFRNIFRQLSNTIGSAELVLYGTDRESDVDTLDRTFQSLMKNEINNISGDNTASSFLSKLTSNDRKQTAMETIISDQFQNSMNNENMLQEFIQETYKNRMIEQADLHEIASQLIELSEAVNITRDAVIQADVVEGRMSRTLAFENCDDKDMEDYIPLVEQMEKDFQLREKLKNFVIPRTLEYGEYFAYTIPYSKIFNDFVNQQNGKNKMYHEKTLLEYVNSRDNNDEFIIHESVSTTKIKNKKRIKYSELIYNEYCNEITKRNNNKDRTSYSKSMEKMGMESANPNQEQFPDKEAFINDIENILSNISVCNDSVPLPIFEEGIDSLSFLSHEYVNESGSKILTESERKTKKSKSSKSKNKFNQILDSSAEGVTFSDDKKKGKTENFDDISDCYIKLIDPTHIIPIKIMSQIIGYYYIETEDITPLSGAVTSNLYYTKFNDNSREQSVIDSLAKVIVSSFDKQFLKENEKFKKTIVEAIQHYNLNEKRLKFQYIPVEYIQEFKIDEDEDGYGQSMIKKSLFYAKLYLMLLLFKIMSIILNSNDMKVNYIKTSGIDKNLANKVQEIARIKQSRQINIYDLFNYTTLINKVGSGSEMYVPVGNGGDRPIETEILSGQDVQLNNDLMENLKNSYILGTGVPAAIINYMNEADFAKVVEQNNTKFNGRVVNYQLDFNSSITEWYKKIMRSSTQIPETLIENFTFTLQPPKQTSNNTKSEAINSFTSFAEFMVTLLYGENSDNESVKEEIREFKKLLADEQLPMINLQSMIDLQKKAKIAAKDNELKPKDENGDDGDDLGLDGL
jgi:uncharacterized membrane-anchored protein YjiN (DUF445 family)